MIRLPRKVNWRSAPRKNSHRKRHARLENEAINELQSLRSALRKSEAELKRVRDEGESRRHLVDILHEVMGDLPTEEIFHFLARRLARALRLSHASVIRANPGSRTGIVATAGVTLPVRVPGLRGFSHVV